MHTTVWTYIDALVEWIFFRTYARFQVFRALLPLARSSASSFFILPSCVNFENISRSRGLLLDGGEFWDSIIFTERRAMFALRIRTMRFIGMCFQESRKYDRRCHVTVRVCTEASFMFTRKIELYFLQIFIAVLFSIPNFVILSRQNIFLNFLNINNSWWQRHKFLYLVDRSWFTELN